jgi:hypothetical protein
MVNDPQEYQRKMQDLETLRNAEDHLSTQFSSYFVTSAASPLYEESGDSVFIVKLILSFFLIIFLIDMFGFILLIVIPTGNPVLKRPSH